MFYNVALEKLSGAMAIIGLLPAFFTSHCFANSEQRYAEVRTYFTDNSENKYTMPLDEVDKSVWRIKIPKEKIASSIKHIDIVFDGAKAIKGENGYFVLGDNRLGHFRAEKGNLLLWNTFMPIFGMKNPRGTFVAIIKGMAFECGIKVEVKKGIYEIFPHFEISKRGGAYDDIVVDFYELEHGDDYCAMARKYRQYQLERGEVKPLRERAKGNPNLAYTAESIFVRAKLAIKDLKNRVPHQTPENEPKLHVYYTYDKFAELMRNLKKLGVEKAEMCMVGWQAGGFDGRYPQYFPVPEELGGEEKLRESISEAKRLGYQIVCHTNSTEWVEIGEGFNIDDIILGPDGKRPKLGGAWVGGITFKPCMKRVWERFTRRDFKMISDLGFRGTHHIDVLGAMKSRFCGHPKHPTNNAESVAYMRKIGEAADRYFGGYGSECGIDHSANSQDYAMYISAYPKYMGPKHPLVDTLIPLWQIAYHGIIVSNPYLETIDYSYPNDKKHTMLNAEFLGSPEKRRLKLIEYGGRPTFYFADYSDLAPIKSAYDDYQPLKHLQYEFMEEHRELAPDVFLTRYSNGEETVCNYRKLPFAYKGKSVPAMDYLLFKPDK